MKKKFTIMLLLGFAGLFPGFSIETLANPEIQTSSEAEVFSDKYLIDNINARISEVPYREPSDAFLKNISSTPGITLRLTEADEITPANFLITGNKLVLSTEGAETALKVYTIITDEIPEPLFFSEYIEGSSNNKALEIFNPTDYSIELKYYRIVQSVNGGGWKDYHLFPDGMSIPPKNVWVIINNKTASELFNHDNANEIEKTSGVVGFNGNDARGLLKITGNDTSLIDVIGISNVDPGTGWDVAGIKNASANKTLIRKARIAQGNTDWLSSAGTTEENSEWIVMPTDYFVNLGLHTFEPGLISSLKTDIEQEVLKVYPCPAKEFLYAENPFGIGNFSIMDISGKIILSIRSDETRVFFDVAALKAGLYFIVAEYRDNRCMAKFVKL